MLTKELEATLGIAVDEAVKRRHEYVTLEHLLFALLSDDAASEVLLNCGADISGLRTLLETYLSEVIEKLPENVQQMPELTSSFQAIVDYAIRQAEGSGQKSIDGGNILAAIFQAEQSYALYLLKQQGVTKLDVLNYISHGISKIYEEGEPGFEGDEDEFDMDGMPRRQRNTLEQFTVELVAKAAEGLIDPIDRPYGRDRAHDPGALPPARRIIRCTWANRASGKTAIGRRPGAEDSAKAMCPMC